MKARLAGHRTRTLYTRLLNRIRRQHNPGDRLGTQVQLAGEYQVSVQTMQRVLAALAEQGWIVRSRKSGTYVAPGPPHVGKRVTWLSARPAETLLAEPHYRDLFAHVSCQLLGAGATISMQAARPHPQPTAPAAAWAALLNELDLDEVDAILALEPEEIAALAEFATRVPVVAIEPREPRPSYSTVRFDHLAAISEAMRRLDQLGCKRIGFWGYDSAEHSRHTRACYQAFLEYTAKNAIIPSRNWVAILELGQQYDRPADQFARSGQDERPDALFICGQPQRAIDELSARGVLPNRDVAIITVGGVGQLPCLMPDYRAMAELVAGELLARLDDRTARPRELLAPVHYRPGG